jgi:hypothetical protein
VNARVMSLRAASCLAVAVSGCAVEAPATEGTVVSVSIPLLQDECGVVSAAAEVSGTDIETVGPVELDVSGDRISGSIEQVPAGAGRIVTVSAYDAQERVVYRGSTQVDVQADAVAAAKVTLARDFLNCPAGDTQPPGGSGAVSVEGELSNEQPLTMLGFRVRDAEYSNALDAIVAVVAQPAALHVIDPETGTSTQVALDVAPTSVSVSPDGLHAAVGHDGYVSYVDLVAGSVTNVFPVSTEAVDVVLGGNGFVYVFPRTDQWTTIRIIDLATGLETTHAGGSIRAGTLAKLHPTQAAIYGADNGLSPSDIEKYDISTGTASYLYDSPYHGDYAMCGNLWISDDGERIYTRCGNTFRASSVQADDMRYAGALSGVATIQALDHAGDADLVALVPGNGWSETEADTVLAFFDDEFLQPTASVALPPFVRDGSAHAVHGQFVFFSADATRTYVLVQADPSAELVADSGLVRLPAP